MKYIKFYSLFPDKMNEKQTLPKFIFNKFDASQKIRIGIK
ncbi:hypothetical protein HPS174_0781 [Glaesserella parasuis 174]|nr:hypothetical protein HPS174_0779 [Glaesserella parasuis 174]EQA13110.1 hypothetical protein HPS174_0781 [Glaesserella parasuis 174]